MPHQLVSSHLNSTTCCTSAPTHHPGFHSPANATCAYDHRFRRSRTRPHRFTSCAHPPVFPVTQWFRPDGTQRNFVCANLFVRYISMKFRPTPAEFIGATTAFPHPNWPQRHPAKTTTHAPTLPPPTPRATTAFLLRLPATSSGLTTAAATAKSPSDAGATATVVDAKTVATTSDLRRHWRPHLPPVLQQVVELSPHSCGQGHNLRRAPYLQTVTTSMHEFNLGGHYEQRVYTRTVRCNCGGKYFRVERAMIAFLHPTRATTTTTASAATAWSPDNDFGSSTLDAARLLQKQRHQKQDNCFGTKMWLHFHED